MKHRQEKTPEKTEDGFFYRSKQRKRRAEMGNGINNQGAKARRKIGAEYATRFGVAGVFETVTQGSTQACNPWAECCNLFEVEREIRNENAENLRFQLHRENGENGKARPHPDPMASQARHESVAQKRRSLTRNVVPQERVHACYALEENLGGQRSARPASEGKDLRRSPDRRYTSEGRKSGCGGKMKRRFQGRGGTRPYRARDGFLMPARIGGWKMDFTRINPPKPA